MKTLVVFYSYSGNTKKIAQEIKAKENADIYEIKDRKKPGIVKAYTLGCIAAIRGKSYEIQQPTVDFASYDKIIVLSPVWAGNPAPAINNVFKKLPSGKDVEVRMVSASGNSSCKDNIIRLVENKNCRLTLFEDINKNELKAVSKP